MKCKLKIFIWIMLPIVLCLLVSCATIPKTEPPQAEEFKADLGTIGIVSARFQPDIGIQKPMAKGAAALHGAGVGVAFVAQAGASCSGLGCAGVLALIPVGAVIGSIVGAVQGVSSENIRDTEHVLKDYLATLHFQETMRDRFLSTAREQTQYPFVLLEVEGPDALDKEVLYDSLAGQGIDTVLEMSVRKCDLRAAKYLRELGTDKRIDPDLRLLMAVGIRLIRITDGNVLWSHIFIYEYESPLRCFREWGVNNGQPFREELDRALEYLSLEIVKALSTIQAPPDPEPAEGLEE